LNEILKRLTPSGAGITGLILAVAVLFSLARSIGKTDEFQDTDFGSYFYAGRFVSQGQSPYVIRSRPDASFVYSPASAYLFVPLQPLGYMTACRVWTVINWAACAACVLLAWMLTAGANRLRPIAWVPLWLAMTPMLSYFWNNVRAGQVGAIMAVGCLGWAVCRRHGRPFVGGLCLAGACALKITPVLLLPYLVLRRDWRGLSGALVGGAALILLPAVNGGWSAVVGLHREWVDHTLHTQTAAQTIRPANQSVLGQLARLPGVSNGENWVSPAGLDLVQRAYPWIVLGLTACIYVAIAWAVRRRRGVIEDDGAAGENLDLTMLFALVTLVNPRAWTCNFVVLILPCAMLARTIWSKAPGWRVALAMLGGLTIVSGFPANVASGPEWSWWIWLNQGRHFWAAVATVLVCVWFHRRFRIGAAAGAQPDHVVRLAA
jgi:alpha-1,2-mannosyltransferase